MLAAGAVVAAALVASASGPGRNAGTAPAVELHGRSVGIRGWSVDDGRVVVDTDRGPLVLVGVTPAAAGRAWLEETLRPGRRVGLRLDPQLHGAGAHSAYRLTENDTDLAELGLRGGELRVDRRLPFRRLARYEALEELAQRRR